MYVTKEIMPTLVDWVGVGDKVRYTAVMGSAYRRRLEYGDHSI